MKMRSTLVINQKPPHSSMATREALDCALATAAFGVEVGVLFIGDGIFQIHKEQLTKSAGVKNTAAIFGSLDLYDIKQVFVRQADLSERALTLSDLAINAQLVDDERIKELLIQFDNLLSF